MISVIMPVYNAEKYLSQSIDSVLNQDMQNIELLLVDDGSKDQSLSICDTYAQKDKRVKVFHQKNKGVSAARNLGLLNAIGEYIAFIDSDDEMKTDMLSSMYLLATKHNADIVSCSSGFVVDGHIVREEFGTNCTQIFNHEDAMKNFLKGGKINIGVWSKLFKREVISGLRFEEGKKINEDKYFIFESLQRCKKFVLYDVTKYLYFQRDDSATKRTFDDRWFDMVYFADKIQGQIDKNEQQLHRYAYINKITTCYWLLLRMYKNPESIKKYKKEYRETVDFLKKSRIWENRKYFYRNMKIQICLLKCSEPALRMIKTRGII